MQVLLNNAYIMLSEGKKQNKTKQPNQNKTNKKQTNKQTKTINTLAVRKYCWGGPDEI